MNKKIDSPTCAPQVTWSSEDVFSTTEGFTRKPGDVRPVKEEQDRSDVHRQKGSSFSSMFE
ncbi:hypothetical protein DPMN_114446 [Dreissena polymorpha]|uniref:Uncharacterized protein n=1 Tax=Dreissena polymorpha TaxID=45954 RepID=A0A9D4QS07_DREPO|nr:hypothetical protein DPMN_114446 [Dreissena polymorpha]